MKKNALHKSDIIAALMENAVTIVLSAFVIFMIFYRPSFHTWANITAIINDCCLYGITALGMTAAIICGDVDLSVSSTYAWSTCLFVILCNSMNVYVAALLTLASCAAWGAINGMLVAFLRMPSFVATLGTMYTIKAWHTTSPSRSPSALPTKCWLPSARSTLRISPWFPLCSSLCCWFCTGS